MSMIWTHPPIQTYLRLKRFVRPQRTDLSPVFRHWTRPGHKVRFFATSKSRRSPAVAQRPVVIFPGGRMALLIRTDWR